MYKIPGIVGLNYVREGRHWGSVYAGHENLVDVFIGVAAFEARVVLAGREVIGANRIVFAVGQSSSGRTVALASRTMTLPAFELGKERLTMRNAVEGNRGLRRDLDRVAGFFLFPPG